MRLTAVAGALIGLSLIPLRFPAASECRKAIAITETVVKRVDVQGGYAGDASRPAFLVGSLRFEDVVGAWGFDADTDEPDVGMVIFLRSGRDWAAFLPKHWEHEYGIFLGSENSVSIFTMIATEGPGDGWTYFHSDDGLRTGRCASLDFPEEVTAEIDYLNLDYFNIQKDGQGIVIGSRGGENNTIKSWYLYRTNDFGEHWSKPDKFTHMPPMEPGEYRQLKQESLPDLVKELIDYSKSQ